MDKHWVTIIIAVLIVIIVVDGIRRMRKTRGASIKMALKPAQNKGERTDDDEGYKSEFPNGGARPSKQKIDPDRIKQARAKFSFGEGIPAWGNKITEKIAEHSGLPKARPDIASQGEPRIEPSLDNEQDPLFNSPTDNTATKITNGPVEKDTIIEEEATAQKSHIDQPIISEASSITKPEASEKKNSESTESSFGMPEQKSLNWKLRFEPLQKLFS